MNHLVYRDEFEAVLNNYLLSKEAAELLQNLTLVLLSGPSASGRNTIINQLVRSGSYRFIVSDTTRLPRVNNGVKEQNGVNYWFRGEEEFLADLKKGQLLEAELIHNQQVSGISIRELVKARVSGKVAIAEVEIGGFNNIMLRKKDTIGIFVLPPDFETWMVRLGSRSQMPKQEVLNRLSTGVRIFAAALESTQAHIVVNQDLEQAVAEINDLVNGRDIPNQSKGKKLAADLLKETREYLSKG